MTLLALDVKVSLLCTGDAAELEAGGETLEVSDGLSAVMSVSAMMSSSAMMSLSAIMSLSAMILKSNKDSESDPGDDNRCRTAFCVLLEIIASSNRVTLFLIRL